LSLGDLKNSLDQATKSLNWQHCMTFAERFRLVFSLSGFANLSAKITGVHIKFKFSAERKHLAIPLSDS